LQRAEDKLFGKMRKLFEAAFYPPSRSSEDQQFAVLPQNTEDELTLSEVHTKLDRALNFLQRDVGYALLDDARPNTGGGVRLRPPPKNNKGDRSAKRPIEDPLLRTSSSRPESPEDLDDSILRTIFDRNGGKLRASVLAEEVYHRQAQNFKVNNGQLDRLFRGIGVDQDREITWEEFEAFHLKCKAAAHSKSTPASASAAPAPQAGQPTSSIPKALADPWDEDMPVISPELAKYAHYQCDLILVSRFAHYLYRSVLQDLLEASDFEPSMSSEAKKTAAQEAAMAVKHDGLYKCVLQGVRLMHLCDYDYADVVLVLAYASVYFRSTFTSIGKKNKAENKGRKEMSPNEAAHVVVLLIYLAHAFLLDETCPLRIWQKHIFRKYCTLKVLDAALFRLFQMRPGYKLRISDEEERLALLGLSGLQYQRGVSEDQAGAFQAMMGMNFTHPKLSDGKEDAGAGIANGTGNGLHGATRNRHSNHHLSNGLTVGAGLSASSGSIAYASNPGSGSSSNSRTPEAPGAASSMVDHRTDRASRSVVQAPSTTHASRVGEATNLLMSQRGHRDPRRAKEPTYASSYGDEGPMPLGATDHALSATAAVSR
jgi:hypothetical protein